MKFQTKLALAALGSALLFFGAILFRRPSVTSQAHVPVIKASDSAADKVSKPRTLNAPAQVEQRQPALAYQGIQIIDPKNPSYDWTLRQMDQSFRSTLQYLTRKQKVADADFEKTVDLLSTARLSQMMYEATAAKVIESNADNVSVVIPTYASEGMLLREYIHKNLPQVFTTPEFDDMLVSEFTSFGTYSQKLEFQKGELDGDQQLYNIVRSTHVRAGIPLKTISTLGLRELGDYTPFYVFFPKS